MKNYVHDPSKDAPHAELIKRMISAILGVGKNLASKNCAAMVCSIQLPASVSVKAGHNSNSPAPGDVYVSYTEGAPQVAVVSLEPVDMAENAHMRKLIDFSRKAHTNHLAKAQTQDVSKKLHEETFAAHSLEPKDKIKEAMRAADEVLETSMSRLYEIARHLHDNKCAVSFLLMDAAGENSVSISKGESVKEGHFMVFDTIKEMSNPPVEAVVDDAKPADPAPSAPKKRKREPAKTQEKKPRAKKAAAATTAAATASTAAAKSSSNSSSKEDDEDLAWLESVL